MFIRDNGIRETMEVVVNVGQGRVDTTERGGNDAVDHNQFFHGNDRVDTLALDFADRHHLLKTIDCLYTITHGNIGSSNIWEGRRGSTGTSRKQMIRGHREITSRFRGDGGEHRAVFVAAIRLVHHWGIDLLSLGIDRQNVITHLHLSHGLELAGCEMNHICIQGSRSRGCVIDLLIVGDVRRTTSVYV